MTKNQIITRITLKVGEHETLSTQALRFWQRPKERNPKVALKRMVDNAVTLRRLAQVNRDLVELANQLRNKENV